MATDPLLPFQKQQFLNLETFRKSGAGIKTPVWFTEADGKLYVRTLDISAKVKRVRHTARVRIVPCDVRGNPSGEWIEAQARLVADPTLAEKINRLLLKKYGLQKQFMEILSWFRRAGYAVIEIQL